MSRDNADAVRRMVDAFNERDVEAVLAVLDPDVEFHSALVEKKTYRGAAGLVRYRQDLDAAWSEWRTDDDRFIEAGANQVLHLYRVAGVGRTSGVSVQQDIAIIWTLRDGKVAEGRVFLDQAEALDAAGVTA